MPGKPTPFKIPPGVLKVDTDLTATGRWTDTEKIRFVNGMPQTMGGWERYHDTPIPGVPRAMLCWADVNGERWVAVASTEKVYVYYGSQDEPIDITPLRASGTLATDPFAVTSGSATVTVTHTNHGLSVGDYIHFSGATAGGGITINGDYRVITAPNANTYTITHSAAASSTDATTGGAAVAYEYEVPIGQVSQADSGSTPWGSGGWGSGYWGGSSGTPASFEARFWSLELFGTLLTLSYNGGRLYSWTPETSSPDRAALMTNCPDSVRGHLITESRFVMAWGVEDDPLKIDWPSQNTLTDWTPTTTNTANTRRLQLGTRIIAGALTSGLSNLMWTDAGLYLITYTGSKFVFDSQIAGRDCGIIGPKAFCMVNSIAYWMGPSGMFRWQGFVEDVPRQEEIWNWFIEQVNQQHIQKTHCRYDPAWGEITWYFPSGISSEPDAYITVSLEDYSWCHGTLDRTASSIFKVGDTRPVMVDEDGYLYLHEVGADADGEAIEKRLVSGPIEILEGEYWYDVNGFVPNFREQVGDIDVTIDAYDRANDDATPIESETLTAEAGTEVMDFRVNGRAVAISLSSNEVGGSFRMGSPKALVTTRGTRR